MRFHQNQHILTIELCSKVCLEAPSLRIRIRLLLSFKFWRKPLVKKSNDKGSGDCLIGKFLRCSFLDALLKPTNTFVKHWFAN